MSHFHQMRENSLQRLFVYWPARRSIPRILPLRDLIFQARKVQLRATRAAGTATCTVWADSGSVSVFSGPGLDLEFSGGWLAKPVCRRTSAPSQGGFGWRAGSRARCGNSLPAPQRQRPRVLLLKRYLEIGCS